MARNYTGGHGLGRLRVPPDGGWLMRPFGYSSFSVSLRLRLRRGLCSSSICRSKRTVPLRVQLFLFFLSLRR